MIAYQKDKSLIIQQVENNTFSSQEVRDFLVDNNELLRKLCTGINKRGKDDGRVFQLAVELGIGVLALTEDRNEFKLIHSPLLSNPSISEIDLVVSRFKELFSETLIAAGKELKEKLGFRIS